MENNIKEDLENNEDFDPDFDFDLGLYTIGKAFDKRIESKANGNIRVIGSKEEFNPLTGLYEQSIEKKLTTKDRKSMKKTEFGIPELKKYPLNDAAHVKSAIRYFDKAPAKYKHSLAVKILKAAKKYDVEVSKTSSVYKVANKSSKSKENLEFGCESFINSIIL